MISQLHPDGTERVTAFASWVLTDAEKKYSTVEKEALACVFAVECWRTYLWGKRFTLRIDHQALSTLLATKGMNRAGLRIARSSARLLCYQYDVVHRAGHKNFVADCLSRMLVESQDHEQNAEPALLAEIDTFGRTKWMLPWTRSTKNSNAEWMAKETKKCSCGAYYHLRHELSAEAPLLLCGSHVLVPVSLRTTLVHLAHEGHQGIVWTKQWQRKLYWWLHMDAIVSDLIKTCTACQINDKSACTHAARCSQWNCRKGLFKK